jgi:2,3,4,5-tetrahydropyridine-2-carboxylate N-succinyltransferase
LPTDREAAIQAFAELISFLYRGEVRAAVVAPGVILTGTTWLHDLLQSSVYRRTPDGPLVIPEGELVVPGTRRMDTPFAGEHGIALAAPVIVKCRDARTNAATAP